MLMGLKVRNILTIALSIQFVALGSIGLELLGLHIPVLRQTIWFIYLTFVPGILIITILKLKLSAIRAVLYSIGLSLSFLMFTGLVINFLLPIVNIQPFSEGSIVIAFHILTLSLFIACFLSNRNFQNNSSIDINVGTIFSPLRFLYLCIVFLSILGTCLLNFFHNNTILLSLLALISTVPLLVITNKIPQKDYPLLIWTISVALLLRATLTSMFFTRTDTYIEYYFANLVIKNNFWDPVLPISGNSLASVAMLIPIFSIGCGMDPYWYFKIFYPIIFSFASVGLYLIYRNQTTEKIAFLSAFFFMSIIPFLDWISLNSRQGIAEFFLVLLMLLILDKEINGIKKTFLSIIFATSLIISHYGLSYIFMFLLFGAMILLFVNIKFTKLYEPVNIAKPNFLILYFTITLSWYMYTSNSTAFNIIPNLAMNTVRELDKFLSPESSTAISVMVEEMPFSLEILKILILGSIFFTFIGVVDLLFKLRRGDATFSFEYSLLSIVSYLMLFISIIPHISISLNIARILHVASFFFSPLCITGILKLSQYITHLPMILRNRTNKYKDERAISLLPASIFLCCFFLFSSCFASVALFKDYPYPLLVTPAKVQEYVNDGKIEMWKTHVYNSYITEKEVCSARWLSKNWGGAQIWADLQSCWMPLTAYGMFGPPAEEAWWQYAVTHVLTNETKIDKGYIYLRDLNVNEGILSPSGHSEDWFSINDISYVLDNSNKIYTNGYSELYYRDE